MDPLSSLLGNKKREDEAKAKASVPKAPEKPSLFAAPDLGDVSTMFGGARRNVASTGSSLFSSDPPVVEATQPLSPQSPPRSNGSVTSGLAAAAAQLQSGAAPVAKGKAFDDMLDGEKVAVTVKSCFLKVPNPLCEVPGRILCTNYRLKFQNVKGGLRDELLWMQKSKYFDVPMGALEDMKVDSKTTVTGATEVSLKIGTKDARRLTFLMSSEEDCHDILSAVSSFSTPGNPTLLFAVKHCEEYMNRCPNGLQENGWDLYSPLQEYARMGVDTEGSNAGSPWKVSTLNTAYGLCSTYPAYLVLPRRMSDQDIRAVAQFRKRGRLPALSWCGGPEQNYAAVFRCAQTTEGLMGNRCHEDERHVACIREGPTSTNRDLLVIDLRPWKAAWANKAGGGGFEGYDRCNLIFGGIDNIHAVRSAWQAMGAAVNAVVDGEVGSWMKDVAYSAWYDYIGAIIGCARKVVVEIVKMKSNVMVHCSDGWDRTAQTTSLAMLCMDAHYRTQAGFLKLIQKEWCAFGHKFRTRLALGETPTTEAAPVFVQWLESVYQVILQKPELFEFTPEVLLRLAHEIITNRFGTFLCDCERERLQSVAQHTLSFWSVLLSPSEAPTWRNPTYRPSNQPMVPNANQACYTVWEDYWFRYHPRGQKLRRAAAPVEDFSAFSQGGSPPLAQESSGGYLPEAPATAPEPAEAGLNALNPLAPAGPAKPRAPPPASASLFSAEEVVPAPKVPPKQFFQDDDDDEDIFAKKSRSAVPAPAVTAPAAVPAPKAQGTAKADAAAAVVNAKAAEATAAKVTGAAVPTTAAAAAVPVPATAKSAAVPVSATASGAAVPATATAPGAAAPVAAPSATAIAAAPDATVPAATPVVTEPVAVPGTTATAAAPDVAVPAAAPVAAVPVAVPNATAIAAAPDVAAPVAAPVAPVPVVVPTATATAAAADAAAPVAAVPVAAPGATATAAAPGAAEPAAAPAAAVPVAVPGATSTVAAPDAAVPTAAAPVAPVPVAVPGVTAIAAAPDAAATAAAAAAPAAASVVAPPAAAASPASTAG